MKLILCLLSFFAFANLSAKTTTLKIFYKEKSPSRKVLAKVDTLISKYQNDYEITYINIEDIENLSIIKELGLPETHFPFAIAIDDKFTAEIEGNIIDFVHFPLFMKGIGRHEGNWSLKALEKVLMNNDYLLETNYLPELDEESETSSCEEE